MNEVYLPGETKPHWIYKWWGASLWTRILKLSYKGEHKIIWIKSGEYWWQVLLNTKDGLAYKPGLLGKTPPEHLRSE